MRLSDRLRRAEGRLAVAGPAGMSLAEIEAAANLSKPDTEARFVGGRQGWIAAVSAMRPTWFQRVMASAHIEDWFV